MLTVKLRFTTTGIHEREGMIINRSIDELLKFNYNNIPVTLMHPVNTDTNEKDILTTKTMFSIIGSICGQPTVENFIDEDGNKRSNLYVTAKIADPYTIEFLNNQKNGFTKVNKENIEVVLFELDTSPAVVSRFEPSTSEDYEFEEIIESIDHLSILIDEDDKLGYWSLYDDSNKPSVEVIDSNNENKIQHTIIVHTNKIDELDNSNITGDKNMAVLETESTSKVDNEEVIDTVEEAVVDEEIKEEEPKVDSEEEPKVDSEEEEKVDSADEIVEEAVEEMIVEAIPEVAQEPVVDNDEEIIDSDEFTEDDREAEILTEIISNLVDSVDDFKKPMFKHHRVSPVSIAKKALKLNKKLVDSKYHSLIEHIDKKSLPLAKEILVDMKSHSVNNKVKKDAFDYVQVSQNTFVKKFI